jgi:hypothetical protein
LTKSTNYYNNLVSAGASAFAPASSSLCSSASAPSTSRDALLMLLLTAFLNEQTF